MGIPGEIPRGIRRGEPNLFAISVEREASAARIELVLVEDHVALSLDHGAIWDAVLRRNGGVVAQEPTADIHRLRAGVEQFHRVPLRADGIGEKLIYVNHR